MTMKRHNEEEDVPHKRVRKLRSQFPWNMFRFGPSIQSRVMAAVSGITTPTTVVSTNCLHCSTSIVVGTAAAISCYFCDRYACEECSLNCTKCRQQFCGFCATRSYGPNDANNAGKCLGC